ncbi:MAG: ribose-5-phosphate isomerase RpiA [Pantoea sp. Brub]|nr:ribose-5-phosphate isomerase RpiA [Pantoea sp. Brub]
MNKESFKKAVGWAAIDYIQPGDIVGVGTGSTIEHFINALKTIKHKIKGTISSSKNSTKKLKNLGIKVLELNKINSVSVYIDSADEINAQMHMIKGGGAALTCEKIIAAVASKFICIVDITKTVNILGNFPLPIEIIPIARTFITNELIKFGGIAKYRNNVITDNGNIILDVHNLKITDPILLEKTINSLPGVVTVGLFASRSADIALISGPDGIKTLKKEHIMM